MSEVFAVIGGEGFVGHWIVTVLCERKAGKVVSLDIVQRHHPEKDAWLFRNCDLTSLESLESALRDNGVTTVFHTASPFIGSPSAICETVNVRGTENIVQACQNTGVRKLVYTSSASASSDGNDLINLDERVAFPLKFTDYYSETKAKAETIVLGANNKNGLLTCVIRPSGIFGPNDSQNINGWMNVYKKGKHKIQMGDNTNIQDWTHVRNIVHGHLLAAEKLGTTVPGTVFAERLQPVTKSLPKRKIPTSQLAPLSRDASTSADNLDPPLPAKRNRFDQWFGINTDSEDGPVDDIPIAGQVYFITAGEPIPFWSWGNAIWNAYDGFDKRAFQLWPGVGLMYATVENFFSNMLGRPLAVPKSAVKISVIHRYYNIEKARRMLGYEPVVGLVDGLKDGMRWYKEQEANIKAPVYAS